MNNDELTVETPQSLLLTWKIPLFFHLSNYNACWLLSPDFEFAGDSYHLRLFPEGLEFGIVLENATNTLPTKDVTYEIGLKSRNGKEIEIDRRFVARQRIYYFPRWEVQEERHVYFSDGNMTVFCFIRRREQSSAENQRHGEDEIPDFSNVLHFPFQLPFERCGELSLESPQSLHVVWKIPNFFELSEHFEYFRKSPEFSFCDDRYCLRLFPSRWSKMSVSIKLVNVSDSLPKTDVSYEVGLKSSTGEEIDIYSNKPIGQLTFSQPVPSLGQFLLDREFFIHRSRTPERQRDSLLPENTLTVFCSVRLREPNNTVGETSDEEVEQEGLPGIAKLRSDLRELLEKGLESDVCLVVRGQEFPAHKNILRARSPIFDAMFSHEMAEKESGRVIIDDLDPENFGDFLEYLYTGVVGVGLSDNNVFGLYKAAHKYNVPNLKLVCVSHMRRNMSVDFFCETLRLALLYNESKLRLKAVQFFKRNMKRIIKTVKWQIFLSENDTTANELLIKATEP